MKELKLCFNNLKSFSNKNYCIQRISETTGVSSDIYCQSINDNHIQTSCAFYVESIQVEHSGELGRKHRKRERDVADWGEFYNSIIVGS